MGVRFTAILSGTLMVIGAGIKVYAFSPAFHAGAFPYDLLTNLSPTFHHLPRSPVSGSLSLGWA